MDLTYTFKEIFPSYADWKQTMTSTGVYNVIDVTDAYAFDQYCYSVLMRKFANVNIRYRDPNDFIGQLSLVYQNRYAQFKAQKKVIDAIYALTLDDIAELSKAINNNSDYPNKEITDVNAPLDFITTQTYSRISSNKIRSYVDAINSIPTLRIDDFIRGNDGEMGFMDLFWNIAPIYITEYKEGDE